jgi:putative transposase
VGFGVSLENAGWSGAMLALENAFTDKVTFCSEHNVSISKNQWPAEHLPSSIIGDRGEMEGFAADALASRLGIEVLNTPAYRPDLKGIVESSFGFINEHLFRQLPGAVRKDEEYGRPDSRLDASLTLNGLRKAMIHYVLWHNRTHRIASYPFSEDMIADNVAPYPNELWHWGIENRSGQLRAMDQKTVRMSLLPFKKDGAAVTRSGIVFNKLHYTCTLAEQEGWYVNARSTGRTRVDVIYDPRDTRKIFLAIGHPVKLLACDLVERDNVFAGKDWYDVEQYFKRVSTSPQMEKSRDLQSTAEYHGAINAIIGEATTQREFDVPDRSKTQRIMDISENRAAEREVERKDTSWVQGLDDDSDISTVEASTTVESEYVAPPNYLNQFSEFADRNDLEEPT